MNRISLAPTCVEGTGPRRSDLRIAAGFILALCALAGCQPNPPAVPNVAGPGMRPGNTGKSASNANTDPCATRLHDLCEPLLLYYALHNQLPPSIDALRQLPGADPSLVWSCPASNLPYVYDAEGIPAGANKGKAILFDAAPSHENMRWAITIIEPLDIGPLVTKVIVMPESAFNPRPRR